MARRWVALLLALALCPLLVTAEEDYRYEIGGDVALTGYTGDASGSWIFASPGVGGALGFAWLPTPRWAFRTNLQVNSVRGNTSKLLETHPGLENFRFSTAMWQIGETAEFNFFAFGSGPAYRKMKRLTPFLTAGLGMALWEAGGKTQAAPALPLGVGLKFKATRRLNLSVLFSMTKVFSDRLDHPALDDPTGIKSSFIKNTDWCPRLALGLAWEFSKRCETCNYKD